VSHLECSFDGIAGGARGRRSTSESDPERREKVAPRWSWMRVYPWAPSSALISASLKFFGTVIGKVSSNRGVAGVARALRERCENGFRRITAHRPFHSRGNAAPRCAANSSLR